MKNDSLKKIRSSTILLIQKMSVAATVILPNYLSKYAGRTLSLGDVSLIWCHHTNVSTAEDTAAEKHIPFDAGEFTGIYFYRTSNGKYSVFALPDDLRSGPEYYISLAPNYELRSIVADHLEKHKELKLSIDDFL